MNKFFKKTIRLNSIEDGLKFFKIYELRVVDFDGKRHVYDRYLSYEAAVDNQAIVDKSLKDLYAFS